MLVSYTLFSLFSVGLRAHWGGAMIGYMSNKREDKKIPPFLKTVYLSNREIRLILAGLYALKMPKDEIESTLWKKLLFEKLHKKTRRKKD